MKTLDNTILTGIVVLSILVIPLHLSGSKNNATAIALDTENSEMDDAAITRQVRQTLASNMDLQYMAVRVETKNGIVTLYGEARSMDDRDLVSRLAGSVPGVKGVNNHITVNDRM